MKVMAQDRIYEHTPKGCTALLIQKLDWPGNEFGLWLPENSSAVPWANWLGDESLQKWDIQREKIFTICLIKTGQSHPPGFFSCLIPTRHGKVCKVTHAFKARKVREKKLRSPGVAIISQTGTIKSDPDDLFIKSVFRHAGGDVCMVVLHKFDRKVLALISHLLLQKQTRF